MSMGNFRRTRHSTGDFPRWDDLEQFGVIADVVRAGKSLQEIAEDPAAGTGGARMLYFRLGRLERALGRRLVDRRRWGRTTHLTTAGADVARIVADLWSTRQRLEEVCRDPDVPVLRIVTHATLVSSLIPAILQRRRMATGARPSFDLELTVVSSYADALAAVNDSRVDVGLYLAFPRFDRVPLPRSVRRQILGSTDLVVLCPSTHQFAAGSQKHPNPVQLSDLEEEHVIVRGYVDLQLLPSGPRGRRIIVSHSRDKLVYVQLGLGVSLLPKLIVDLLGLPKGVVMLPLRPTLTPALCLLRPRKRLRPLGDAAEEFLEELGQSCRAALRASAAAGAHVLPRIMQW